MAKMKVGQLKKKAAAASKDGSLADAERYAEALELIENDEWVKAEAALKRCLAQSILLKQTKLLWRLVSNLTKWIG